jgi:3-deoxy-D-manno-octulosonic-acid transferase
VIQGAAQLAYDVVGVAALAMALPAVPWLWYRGWTEGLNQRLGAVPWPAGGFERRPLWLHAASVGETLAALPLLDVVRREHPTWPWVVSNTTVAGRAVAQREMRPDVSTLMPIDAARIVDRAFASARPRALIVVEKEIWPGMLRAAENAGASIVFVSARMTEEARSRYSLAGPLFAAALGRVDAICAQTEEDAARLCALGAVPGRVCVTGNLKAGRAFTAIDPPPLRLGDRPAVVAASTQPGEEEFVLDACAALWRSYPDMLLVLAPRRPERFGEVADLLQRRGVAHQRRSTAEPSVRATTQVLLLDTLGELVRFYGAAVGVFVGGTVAPLGGHNVLEPAVAGVAVSFGTHVDNVRAAAAALCAAGAAASVDDAAALAAHWSELLSDPARAAETGRRAGAVAATLAGAVAATVAVIEPFLRGES